MTIQESAPNTASVWIQLITTLGTIATVIVTQLLANKRNDRVSEEKAAEVKKDLVANNTEVKDLRAVNDAQTAKLETVHALVNGDRLAKVQRIATLEAKLRKMGVDEP